jgi:DNA-binding transcriptional ArsR family regulator
MDTKKKADLILHPIRMRILMALADEKKTAQQLADELRDVPQATLYRHVNRLAKAGVIQVVEQRQVRGSIERVYALQEGMSRLSGEDAANFSKDDHMRIFIAFVASLLDDFSRFLQHAEKVDLAAEGIGFQKFPLELSDEEVRLLGTKINTALEEYLHNQPGQGRRRRILSFTIMPDPSEGTK